MAFLEGTFLSASTIPRIAWISSVKFFSQGLLALRQRRRVLTTAGVSALSVALVAGAVLYPGFATADVELNDGGVWVTNQNLGMVGHLNYQSQLIDGGYTANSDGFDVAQAGRNVLNLNTDQAMVSPVDIANVMRGTETQLPGSADIAMGSDVVAITEKATGTIWITKAGEIGGFSDKTENPVLKESPGAVAAVSSTDTVVVADPSASSIFTYTVADDGSWPKPSVIKAEQLSDFGNAQIAAVGNQPVVFDSESGVLILPDGQAVTVANSRDARLQQSGAASDHVAVATTDGLVKQPLDGGEPVVTDLDVPGPPAAPVQQGDCIYAAWASARYIRDCADDSSDRQEEIKGIGGSADLVFRVNRDVVVLNDMNAGDIWLVNQNMLLVNNWGDIMPPQDEADNEEDESANESLVTTLPDRTKENRPPVAEDDSFGARAGQTTILTVLDNDTDPDGDLLRAKLVGDAPEGMGVQPVYDGGGLQVVVPENASPGQKQFSYEVGDGRGGKATANVTVRIKGIDSNEPPKAKRATTILVEEGKSVSQNILSNWTDPDGDDLFLVGAEPTDVGDQVRSRYDGMLTFRDIGKTLGPKEVRIEVSDGRETTSGVVTMDVQAIGLLPPVVNFDHVSATVGQQAEIAPLKNDIDATGGELRLAKVTFTGDAKAVPDYETGTVKFTPTKAGTYYIEYLATNGPKSASGLIRVDAEADADAGAPIAVRDVALLPGHGAVLVDVLGNDSDSAGGILVVQSVEVAAGSPLKVAVLEHNVLRIHDVGDLAGQETIKYTVSNGKTSATGEVNVLSIESEAEILPPRAEADTAIVRSGDVVNIPVLDNDTHPNGDELALDPIIAQDVATKDGQLFVSENTLRFVAGDTAKTVYAIYEVVDSAGQKDSAEVRITIRPKDGRNTPPTPSNVDARVIAGSTVRIPIPLSGLDADGDSVSLTGIDQAPELGAAVAGPHYIDYTASATAGGTDSFTYAVQDRLGAVATATVQVGIAPLAEKNQKPVAVDDGVALRPGRAIAVDALRNDSDPDGDPIALVGEGVAATPETMAVEVKKGRVLFTAPEQGGTYNVRYMVKDSRGADAVGNIRVSVDKNAPLIAPIARDDRVEPAETMGREAVDVPVLENDEDPDGVAEDLAITVDTAKYQGVSVVGGVVKVELADGPRTIPYTVEDIDGGLGTALIWVPGRGQQHPVLTEKGPIDVTAGQELTLELADYVRVREGRTPRITVQDNVSAIGTSTKDWVSDENTLSYKADIDYAGTGSITFEVTDGSGPDDPEGLKSTLTVLTNVIPDKDRNFPPTFTSGSLEVAKAESAVSLDLRALADDPNPDDADKLEFALEGELPNGFRGSLDGSTLSIEADSDTAVGATGKVSVSVTDGRSAKVTSSVDLVVLASSRPLPVANEDTVPEAVQGKSVPVDVLANDVNPFPDSPLEIVDVVADGNGTASKDGDRIVVTPAETFVGSMSVTYTVRDKTQEDSRRVSAQILLTVEGKPGVPSTPAVESVRNQTVVMAWDPPASNGSAITSYEVTSNRGFSQECATTTCTLTGLTNNTEYIFRVAAVNEHGTSDPSPESAPARPDAKPEQPQPPALTFGDGELAVKWTPPANEGSPIEKYTLQISPAPASGASQKTSTGTMVTWTGLQNGTAYKVRVQAQNKAPDPSDWSDYSAAEIPAGKPAVPAAPNTQRVESVGSQSQLSVDWNDVANNGAAVAAYEVREYVGNTLRRTLPVTSVSEQTITVPNAEQDYTYDVRAKNKAGWSEYGAQSAPRRAVGAPAAPAAPQLKPTHTGGAGESVSITFSALAAAQRNGARAGEVSYQASFNGGGWRGINSGDVVGGFANGSNVSATVRAVVNSDGAKMNGAPSGGSNAVVPYGRPHVPNASSGTSKRGDKRVYFTWSAPSPNGRAVDYVRYRHLAPTKEWINGGTSGKADFPADNYGKSVTLEFQTCDVTGQCSGGKQVSGLAGDRDQWTTQLNTGMERSCTDPANRATYDTKRFTCEGKGGNQPPWFYAGQKIVVQCWIDHKDGYGVKGPWYRVEPGSSRNVGRYVDAGHTSIGRPQSSGAPRC
ncbi:Ig-like domain-containing protein [Arthrobacter roseus]|uniref:Ig-like domain-containing protein n=1 Tax=Arthrobacter roseus TaxID=136274 RepID=UPI001963C8C4|nr:Ig-like domain-containing protein [Arthrobacter roseus]MBM7848071.1 hypothetical protein [Arthrobacter roseus]